MERPIWDRIQEIYDSTLPVPQSERSAFIARACDDDPFIVREVTSLLKADDSSAGFLESSVFELGLKIISSDSAKAGRICRITRKSGGLTTALTSAQDWCASALGLPPLKRAPPIRIIDTPVRN